MFLLVMDFVIGNFTAGIDSFLEFGLLTDIVLKDQIVVYDNEKQRIGWKPFDCKFLFLLQLKFNNISEVI